MKVAILSTLVCYLGSATALIARQAAVTFTASTSAAGTFYGNVTGARNFQAEFTFTALSDGSVQVTLTARGFPALGLNRRQIGSGINYGVFGTGINACSLAAPSTGGALSAVHGPLVQDPTSSQYIDTGISVDQSSAAFIGGKSLVFYFSDGSIIACIVIVEDIGGTIPTSTTTTTTTATITSATETTTTETSTIETSTIETSTTGTGEVPMPTVIVNVNVDVNVNVELDVCSECEPLTTVLYKAVHVPHRTAFHSFGNYYVCEAPGWYTIACPYTIMPGHKTVVPVYPSATYPHQVLKTETVAYGPGKSTTTTYTHPASICVPTAETITPSKVSVPLKADSPPAQGNQAGANQPQGSTPSPEEKSPSVESPAQASQALVSQPQGSSPSQAGQSPSAEPPAQASQGSASQGADSQTPASGSDSGSSSISSSSPTPESGSKASSNPLVPAISFATRHTSSLAATFLVIVAALF